MSAEVTVLAVGERTLAELAVEIRQERDAAGRLVMQSLEHVAAAGVRLIEAKRRVPAGQFKAWLAANVEMSYVTAAKYMRAGEFHERALAELGPGASLSEVLRWLQASGLDRTAALGSRRSKSEARMLGERYLAEGMTPSEVATLVCVQDRTVRGWMNPQRGLEANRRSRARRKAEQERQERQAIKRAARKKGGARAELYAMAERMQDVMGQAHREATDSEERRAYALAGQHYRKMRDEIVRALGVS